MTTTSASTASMVLFVMSYNNNDSYIDPNKIYRTDMNNSTDTNVLNEQVTSLLLLYCTTLHLSTHTFIHFRLAACFHVSCLAQLSLAHLRHVHNCCFIYITGPSRTLLVSGTFTARPRSVPHCFWPVPLRLPATLRFLHWQQVAKDAVSKWRALRRRGDPGTDIPDSLPRNTRVGSLPRKIGTVNHIRSAPERGLPFWVGPSEPCIKTGARWAEPKWGTSSLVFILHHPS